LLLKATGRLPDQLGDCTIPRRDSVRRVNRSRAFAVAERVKQWLQVQRWKRAGREGPLPAPVKYELLRENGRRFALRTLVETGTYRGGTMAALADDFDRVSSVELDDRLYEAAHRRFDGVANVEILHGDSGDLMPEIVEGLDAPTLFWLDGHYSAGVTARGVEETPILRELDAVLGSGRRGDVVLVDDARCFTGENGWPSRDEVRERVRELEPEYVFEVESDIIRIHAQAA